MSDKSEFNITTKRFRELIDNEKYAKVPRAEIAKATGCDTSTITKYYNGQRQLSVDSIIKFSKYFNVSSDYLLGLSDVQTTNIDVQFICDFLGLDEQSVCLLNFNAVNYDENYSFNNGAIRFLSVNQDNIFNYLHYLFLAQQAVFSDNSSSISNDEFNDYVEQATLYQYKISKSFAKYINTKFFTILSEIEDKKEKDYLSMVKHFLQENEILEKDIEQNNNIDDDLPF